MGFIGRAKKKTQEIQARIERERLKSLQGQRKRSEASAIRSRLRQKELKRISAARKTTGAESKLRQKSRGKRKDVDFGSIFFDTPKKKAPVKRKKKKKASGKKSSGQTITIKVN